MSGHVLDRDRGDYVLLSKRSASYLAVLVGQSTFGNLTERRLAAHELGEALPVISKPEASFAQVKPFDVLTFLGAIEGEWYVRSVWGEGTLFVRNLDSLETAILWPSGILLRTGGGGT